MYRRFFRKIYSAGSKLLADESVKPIPCSIYTTTVFSKYSSSHDGPDDDNVVLPYKQFHSYLKHVHRNVSSNSTQLNSKPGWPPTLLEVFGKNPKSAASNLETLVDAIHELEEKVENLNSVTSLVSEVATEASSTEGEELMLIAEEEKRGIIEEIGMCDKNIIRHLSEITQCDPSVSSVVLEISAGVGGQEAMLFASELFEMYDSLCTNSGQKFEILDVQRSEIGGIHKASANIHFSNQYFPQLLKHESGIHRVQRVPMTEKSSRIHTSTASVAFLPVLDNEAIIISERDVEVTPLKKASGGGGQKVNKTETAVRVKHISSGKVVECNMSRSQHENKERAMKLMGIQLTLEKTKAQETELTKARQRQVKNRERSDKIRTYNFSQDRVTDHRIHSSVHNIREVMAGRTALINLLQQLNEKYDVEEVELVIETLLKEGKEYYGTEFGD